MRQYWKGFVNMVNIEKEGYVAVQNNTIPLRNYLFYLTYNDRASTVNNMKDVDLTSSSIYQASRDYYNKRHSESSVKSINEKGEIVMSFSSRLCYLVTKHKFRDNLQFFKRDFEKTVNEILAQYLEQPEYSIFIHEYDSKQMRVHAHVLFYPYLDSNISLKMPDGEKYLRPHKQWIEPHRLADIKKAFNEYAQRLYTGLEVFDKSTPENLPFPKIERKPIFDLVKISPAHKPEYTKDELESKWLDKDINQLNKAITSLSETTDDVEIRGNRDFSIVVDYLYDFDDQEAYKLFFGHKALRNIIKKFSVFKSNPKFSSVFLKLLSINKESDIVDMVEGKTQSTKAQELFNILSEYYTDDPDRVYEQNDNIKMVRGYEQ